MLRANDGLSMKPPRLEFEIWREIDGWNDRYLISNLGRVWSVARRKILTNTMGNRRYLMVSLFNGPRVKCVAVHRLVAIAFITNPKNKETVNHINGIKTDNRVENLEWATREDQLYHAINTLGLICGEGSTTAILTTKDVIEIRSKYKDGRSFSRNSYVQFAKEYGVNWRTIYNVVKWKSWKHVK